VNYSSKKKHMKRFLEFLETVNSIINHVTFPSPSPISTETLTDSSKEVGLKVNAQKTKYMLLSRHQNAGQNHDIKTVNRSCENRAQFKYLGMTVTNQNLIQEKIKRRLNSGNACYHSVQNLLSSRPLSKNIKIRIHKTIILHVVL
jgi:hypothetical protein